VSKANPKRNLTPDVTISIISSDSLDLLLPCLQSVFASCHGVTVEVFVIDNASLDGTASEVQTRFNEVKVIRRGSRKGFSTNNNQVLRAGRGRYLMLLNDDTQVLDGALDHLVTFMDNTPQAGAAGSLLINPDGSVQSSFAWFPNPFLEAIWPAAAWSRFLCRHDEEPIEVDSICGAALLMRRAALEMVGMLDTSFDPVYSEEVDWCYRARQAGWKIYSLPKSRIVHYGGQTMNHCLPQKYELLLSHKLLYFRKNWGSVSARLYQITLGITTVFKLVCWALLTPFLKNRQDCRGKVLLHWQILKRLPGW